MRILLISEMSPPYATGGGEVRYALLARKLAGEGHDVSWLSMKQRQSPAGESIDGVRHLHRGPRIRSPPTRPLVAKLWFMAQVVLHLVRHRYDVVDCQTYAPLPAAWLACRLRGTPLVATIHDTAAPANTADQWLSTTDRLLVSPIERWLYRLSYDRVLTVSRAVRDELVGRLGVDADRVRVVANAVDLEALSAVKPHADRADLVFVGRLVPHKHPELFLEVAAAIDARRRGAGLPPLRVKMIGGGPLAPQVADLARRLGLSGQLSLHGELSSHLEVMAHVRASRVLLLPSTREGFGLVLAEAMAVGTAVVAFRLAPVIETLGPELQDGLVEPGNVGQLAEAAERLLADGELWEQRVASGRRQVTARHGADRFMKAVLAVYREAAVGAGPGQHPVQR